MAHLILRTLLKRTGSDVAALIAVAERWVAAARAEAGVIAFDGFMLDDDNMFVFLEQYRDSEAFMAHRALVDPALRAELYASAKFESLEVYGDPSDTVRTVLAPAGARFFRNVASH